MATAKSSTVFTCNNCGYQSAKWLGKCSDCNQWNTLVEETFHPTPKQKSGGEFYTLASLPTPLVPDENNASVPQRISTSMNEMDRLMGGGLVPGSVTLIGGDPGIGKSTLMLQIQDLLAKQNYKTFYLTGEESIDQINLRARRLGISSKNITVLAENNLDVALKHVSENKPTFLVVDSIQTVYLPELGSAPGSVSQVRECAGKLLYFSKSKGITTWLIGQVTKEGSLAGPKVLEHLVDTVLYFEGDSGQPHRMLRTFKNRFGATHEVGVFEMRTNGLMPIDNPSEFFLSHKQGPAKPGAVVVSSLEGSRPLLAELQALVVSSHLGTPRRVTVGVESARVALLAAVLEKVCGLQLGGHDIYINVVGGLSISEPAVDLGIILAMASSFLNKSISSDTLVMGEVGLTGEIRPITNVSFRLAEAAKLGYTQIILPQKSYDDLKKHDPKWLTQLKLHPVSRVNQCLEII